MSAQKIEHGAASSAARELIRKSFGTCGPFAMGRGTAVAIETNDKGTAMATDHVTCGETPIFRIGLRRFSFPVLLMLFCISASMTFAADAMSQSAEFDIAPQAMESALHEWSRQSNVQVMVASHDVSGQSTDGIRGRFTAASALAKLLQQTNLTYEPVGNNTVSVKRVAAATEPASPKSEQSRLREQGGAKQPKSDNDKRRNGALEEVIVTAQKREERLQDVPISISVLSGVGLDRSTVPGVHEALNTVPGVRIDAIGGTGSVAGGTQVAVRGVTAPSSYIAGSSPVGYYLDTVPFGLVRSAIVPDLNAYDLERVEALRGPQGTLYGANAQAGVVRVLTKNANLDAFELKARTSGSSTEHGGESYRGDMAVNVPFVDGKLAARAVVSYQELGGWIDKPTREDANDGQIGSARLKLNAQPSERLSVGLSAWMSRSDFGAMPVADNTGLEYSVADVEHRSEDFESYGLKVGYDFSAFSLTSTTSYLDYFSDNHFGEAVVAGVTRSFARTTLPATIFAQEVNLASRHEGSWRWTAGGIYRDGVDRIRTDFAINTSKGSLKYESKSWAAFGELTRLFLDGKLEFTAGLRHFEDEVALQEEAAPNVQPAQFVNADSRFHATTPRLILNWHPREQMTVYASYSEGFRSGVHQTPAVIRAVPSLGPAEPDTLINYELGAKGAVWGGRVGYDAAVYYMDWQDVQLPLILRIDNIGRSALVNGASASGVGVDFALTVEPAEGLKLAMNFSWNDLTLDEDVFSNGIRLFDAGDRLNQSAETTVGAVVDYAFPLGEGGFEGRLSAGADYTSERTEKALSGSTVAVYAGDAITIARASFSIESPDHWGATLFADNLNDERGVISRTVLVPVGAMTVYPRPRTIGVQLEYRF